MPPLRNERDPDEPSERRPGRVRDGDEPYRSRIKIQNAGLSLRERDGDRQDADLRLIECMQDIVVKKLRHTVTVRAGGGTAWHGENCKLAAL